MTFDIWNDGQYTAAILTHHYVCGVRG